ncbi:hypothetical protein LCGC14_2706340 [marine sediment metagenome]|uniref:Uncharacterized protein n=1 Tax=marine sediment metagenome TaxID=412755 RepID=A0A0F8ZEB6_9ZZZZ
MFEVEVLIGFEATAVPTEPAPDAKSHQAPDVYTEVI